MSDEKILKDELMDDVELDGVAGGTLKEALEDREYLKKLGAYDFDSKDGFTKTLQNGFAKLGDNYGMKITVDVDLNKNNANKYFVNGKEMSRDKLFKMIDTLSSK
ncbi:MAG: hypothetical protein IJS29_07340 [Selenomonadaceae bacterium]|nr:hypothetical protein [Selenomonadaceae bacterium]